MFRRVPAWRLQEIDVQKVCILKPSALGDIVQTLPLLSALRARFPEAHLAWVIKRELADLVIGHPSLDEIIAIDFRTRWLSWARHLAEFRSRRFDLVLDLQGLARTAVFMAASGAPLRVGLEAGREGSSWTCHCLLPDTGLELPVNLRYQRVAEAFGISLDYRDSKVQTSAEDRRWSRQQLASLDRPVVAIHAGAQWPTKQWPVDKFCQIASRMRKVYAASIVLVGGPEDRQLGRILESALCAQDDCRPFLNLVGRSSLKQLAALLGEVDCLLSNDSGPMHLAAGMGTPVLGIFTCTDPTRSGPVGHQHELVPPKDLDCAGCYKKRCPLSGSRFQACLQMEDDVERVWQAMQRLVAKNRLAERAA